MKLYTLLIETKKIMMESEKVTLSALCDNGELWDEKEHLSQFNDQANDEFEVRIMPHDQIPYVKTYYNDTTVLQAFKDFAISWQKKLVAQKIKNFDDSRIVIMYGNRMVDGNHHLIAAYKNKKPLKYIDLEE